MFWKFNVMTTQIDTLLEKEDVTLHELLDEDDVLQECKAQNSRLVNFLIQPENIEELVNLVTQEPSDYTDEKTKYKFPNTACELLTSDVGEITDTLMASDALLAKIYAFLAAADGPLNSLLASFFSKLMGLLILRKSDMMIKFLRSKDDFVGRLLHHIGTSAVMDLLLRLITCIESPDMRNTCIAWLNEQQLVQKLMNLIDVSQTEEEHNNASQSLCDIIRLSREQMAQLQEKAPERDPLLATIESTEALSTLLSHMFDHEHQDSVLVNGINVIQTLLEFRKIGPDGLVEDMTELDTERHAQGVGTTLDALAPRLKDLHQILVQPPKQWYNPMQTTYGCLAPPLGSSRLHVARLITSLLHANRHSINVQLANLGTVGVLMELMFKYQFNNFLHTQVEQCVYTILTNPPTEADDKSDVHPLLDHLFNDVKILDKLMEGFDENEQQQCRPGGHRKGYMGHITKMAADVSESMEKGTNVDRIKELYQECPEERRECWEKFVSGILAELIRQSTCTLVTSESRELSTDDDDPEFSNISFPTEMSMQKAFTDYEVHQMTSNFINQFGFDDDEFTEQEDPVNSDYQRISNTNFNFIVTDESQAQASVLFEQMCNEKRQQLDDGDSDEDLWDEKEVTFSSELPKSLPPSGGAKATHDDDSDLSDDGTDSEEELDSPGRIYQTPPGPSSPSARGAAGAGGTAMEVDTAEPWSNFVGMETTLPWQGAESQASSATAAANSENWAHFDAAPAAPTAPPPSTAPPPVPTAAASADAWADFRQTADSLFNSTASTVPRSNSPVAMETSESSIPRCSYLAASAPADLASEVAAAVATVNGVTHDSAASIEDVSIEDVAVADDTIPDRVASIADEEPSPGVEPSPPTAIAMLTPVAVAADVEVSIALAEPPAEVTVEVSMTPAAGGDDDGATTPVGRVCGGEAVTDETAASLQTTQASSAAAVDDSRPTTVLLHNMTTDDSNDMEDDDSLDDNFDFLRSCGLMKSAPSPAMTTEESAEDERAAETAEKTADEGVETATATATATAMVKTTATATATDDKKTEVTEETGDGVTEETGDRVTEETGDGETGESAEKVTEGRARQSSGDCDAAATAAAEQRTGAAVASVQTCSGDDSGALAVSPTARRTAEVTRDPSPLAASPAAPSPDASVTGASLCTENALPSGATTGSSPSTETKSKQQQLEEMRAEAIAALQMFTSATKNGPV